MRGAAFALTFKYIKRSQKRMANKRSDKENSIGSRASDAKKRHAAKTSGTAKKTVPPAPKSAAKSLLSQLLPFIFYVSALLVLLVLVLSDAGFIVKFLRGFLFGMFSAAAFTIPILLVLLGVFWSSGKSGRIGWRFWCSAAVILIFNVLFHIVVSDEPSFSIGELYTNGATYQSGGVVGGLIGSVFLSCFGAVISIVILGSAMFVLCLLLFGLTPNAVYHIIKGRAIEKRDIRRAEAEARRAEEETRTLTATNTEYAANDAAYAAVPATDSQRREPRRSRGGKFDPDVDMSADKREKKPVENRDVLDQKIFDEVMRRTRERYGEQSFDGDVSVDRDNMPEQVPASIPEPKSEPKRTSKRTDRVDTEKLIPVAECSDDGDVDLSKIFVDPDAIELLRQSRDRVLEAERKTVSEPKPAAASSSVSAPTPEPEYVFPPLSMLAVPKAASAADVDELRETAQRLVDTLRSFNVKTKISDVFHGPTITRYELTPESGTRVRAIANLADDIALSLAAPGVRIEAPIPGKAAVGVEVPNRVRENVVLRGLLENDEFKTSESRLMTALGCDVAGAPVYCDISKMPHLLVAGATGMGKSVCINSIVTSLLYKARPDEVRLIMIDPKKVEFAVYNGIPHLHVPVVTDPKKAAGTLAWAVGEMERRYEVIESVGVRNIAGYNEITRSDPEKSFMPQMVIIIDELADLMMTAPDDVETHICRIAQMGRAAGVHLIIGTQRPSVDVITGLIKANIPSRIACKTSSQVDSRTIIDSVGAEKLLGRGDMLYAPVGVMKPQRLQGAFVSDAEVEKITDFLKGSCPTPHYDEAAIDGIEEAARQCGNGKKSGGRAADDGGEVGANDDPMLRQALELAVDSGKISTSLIQRRLSLGYGRAAKLIDRMEELGYVSAPDGQRPREVLITRQQFQELVLKDAFE